MASKPQPKARPGNYLRNTAQQSMRFQKAARNLYLYGVSAQEIKELVDLALAEYED